MRLHSDGNGKRTLTVKIMDKNLIDHTQETIDRSLDMVGKRLA